MNVKILMPLVAMGIALALPINSSVSAETTESAPPRFVAFHATGRRVVVSYDGIHWKNGRQFAEKFGGHDNSILRTGCCGKGVFVLCGGAGNESLKLDLCFLLSLHVIDADRAAIRVG